MVTELNPVTFIKRLGRAHQLMVALAVLMAVVAPTAFVLTFSQLFWLEMISIYVTSIFLLWIGLIDAKYFTIPNQLLLMWLGIQSIILTMTLVVGHVDTLINATLGAVVMGIFFLITYYLSKKTLGGGDVKLAFIMGLSMGIHLILSAVFYGLIICAVFSIVALATKKLTKKDALPLAPFLFCGMIATYLLEIIAYLWLNQ